jgi:hypothetical protein
MTLIPFPGAGARRWRSVAAFIVLGLVAGCAKNVPEAAAVAPGGGGANAGGVNRYLAYEHALSVNTEAGKVVALVEAVQAACRAATDEACAILQSGITSGDAARATLKFRAKAGGIKRLVAVLSSQGEIASQSTTAEDLAGPIEDTAKKLTMLTAYRSQLEALRGRGNADMDSLIKLTRELADVQSQIETLSGSQAQLMQRVQTEILTVAISSFESQSFWQPIGEAFSEFGDDLSEGIATVITVVAFLLPWAILALLGYWVVRVIRRRRRAQKT